MAAKRRNPNGSGNICKRKDGRYELKVFVETPDGRRKRISVYFSTWDDADAERTRLKDLQRKGIPIDSTTSTVEQYMQYWLTEIAHPSVRETTFSSYELLVRLYVVPGLGKRKLRAARGSHPLLAERITDNLSMLCARERHRQSDEGQSAVQREETRSVLRAGQDATRLDPRGDAMVGG